MLEMLIIGIVCSVLTTGFILLEIHWSLQNLFHLWEKYHGIWRFKAIILTPLCFLPVLWDIAATLGFSFLFGLSGGMFGMATAMMASSTVAGFLAFKRRKHGWRYA